MIGAFSAGRREPWCRLTKHSAGRGYDRNMLGCRGKCEPIEPIGAHLQPLSRDNSAEVPLFQSSSFNQ
jgi:hypothetical protein